LEDNNAYQKIIGEKLNKQNAREKASKENTERLKKKLLN